MIANIASSTTPSILPYHSLPKYNDIVYTNMYYLVPTEWCNSRVSSYHAIMLCYDMPSIAGWDKGCWIWCPTIIDNFCTDGTSDGCDRYVSAGGVVQHARTIPLPTACSYGCVQTHDHTCSASGREKKLLPGIHVEDARRGYNAWLCWYIRSIKKLVRNYSPYINSTHDIVRKNSSAPITGEDSK